MDAGADAGAGQDGEGGGDAGAGPDGGLVGCSVAALDMPMTAEYRGDLVATADKVLVAGSILQGDGPFADTDMLVVELDPSGAPAWATTVDASSSLWHDNAHAVVALPDGGALITGLSRQPIGLHDIDIPLVRLDGQGNLVYSKMLGGDLGGETFLEDQAWALVAGPGGDAYLAGDSGSFVDGDCVPSGQGECSPDALLCRLDAQGAQVWCRNLGWTVDAPDSFESLAVMADGDLLAAGITLSIAFPEQRVDVLISRFAPDGAHRWTRTLRLPASGNAPDLVAMDDGGAVVLVNTLVDGWHSIVLVRLDAAGGPVWSRAFTGGADYGLGLARDPDGGVVVSGSSAAWGNGTLDWSLLRVDAGGALKSYHWLAGPEGDGDRGDHDLDGRVAAVAGGFLVAGQAAGFSAPANDLWLLRYDGQGATCAGQFVAPDALDAPFELVPEAPTVRPVTLTIVDVEPGVDHPAVARGAFCP